MATTYELIVKAVDQTKRPLRNIEKGLDRIEKKADRVNGAFKKVGLALAAVVTGQTARSIVNTTARFEDLRDTLNTVTGSARAGGQAFDFVQQFATQTQFGIEELTTTFIKLKGAGIEPTEKLLTTFTDTAAVTTDQLGTLEAMADLFSRTTAGGLGLEELNRLADRGVPVFRILEQQLGLTRLEISEFGKTAEGAEKIRSALQRGLDQSFGGATQDKLDNLSTAMSNFGIEITLAAAKIGNEFRPQLTEALNEATAFIKANDQLAKSIGQGVGEAIKVTAESLKFLADNFDALATIAKTVLGLKLIQYFGNIAKQVSSFSTALAGAGRKLASEGKQMTALQRTALNTANSMGKLATKIGLVLRFLGPVGAVVGTVITAFQLLKDNIVTVGNTSATLGQVFAASFNLIKEAGVLAFNNVVEAINNFLNLDGVSTFINTFLAGFRELGVNALAIMQTIGQVIGRLFENVDSAAVTLGSGLGTIFTNIGNGIVRVFGNILNKIMDWYDGASDLFTNFSAYVSEVVGDIGRFFSNAFSKIGGYAKTGINFVINTFIAAGTAAKDIFTNIPANAALAFDAIGLKVSSWVEGFKGYMGMIEVIWNKMLRTLATNFADFISKTGNIFNQAAEMLGMDPVFDTMGIQAWASSFDGVVVRSENRVKQLFANSEKFAQQASDKISQIDLMPNTDFGAIFSEDRVGAAMAGLSELGTQAASAVRRGFGEATQVVNELFEGMGDSPAFETAKSVFGELTSEFGRIAQDFETNKENINLAIDGLDFAKIDSLSQTLVNLLPPEAVAALEAEIQKLKELENQITTTAETTNTAAQTFVNYDDSILRMSRGLGEASTAAQIYDDAILRMSRGLSDSSMSMTEFQRSYEELIASSNNSIAADQLKSQLLNQLIADYRAGTLSLQQYNAALLQLGLTSEGVNGSLSEFELFTKGIVESATAAAQQIDFAAQAKAVLKQQLDEGKISIDVYAKALEQLNSILGQTGPAAGSAGSGIGDTTKQIKSAADIIKDANKEYTFQTRQTRQNQIAVDRLTASYKRGDLTLQQLRGTMQAANLDLGSIKDMGTSVALTLEDSFKQMGNQLSSNLARGILRGENLLDSFKDFALGIMEQILQQIIQKSLVDPLINNLFGGMGGGGGLLSGLFGGFGGGFGGIGSLGRAGGFNPLGSLFGGLFGGGGGFLSFLGFAKGGVVPGMPTAGDSVPALLTPGEVVLNRQQQSQLLAPVEDTPPPVNISINAIDTQTGTEFLLKNKRKIQGIVQQAYNERGSTGGPNR